MADSELSGLIESTDIVEYIGQFVDMEKKGEEYWGLSPFKEEKTPSFSVRSDPPCFFDYSSGIGGNVFTFVRYYFHCSSQEAIDILKRYAGGEAGERDPKREKLDAVRVFEKFSPKKGTQKESTGVILPDDVMLRFENREDKLSVWEKEGISRESLERFQVRYDAVANRLVYPIRNMEGKIVNIGGRTLDPDWKERGLRKYTYYYKWGTLDTVYGMWENLQEIGERREIILFEGCKSVLLADTWGIKNTGAILTSHLNPNQRRILSRTGARTVFALDSDVDVRKDHNIKKLWNYVNVEYLFDMDGLLNEKDSPVDKGKEVFLKLYEQRRVYR